MGRDEHSGIDTWRKVVIWTLGAFAVGAGAAAQPAATPRCSAGQVAGVPPEHAETAVAIVCDELTRAARKAGVTAGDFSVDLRPLGQALVLTLSRESPADGRTLRLESIEEVPTAAPRVVEALVYGLPLDATQRVDNLVASETRYTPLRRGSVKPTFGVVGLTTLGHSAPVGAGFSLGLEYVTPRFAIPGELRWAGNTQDGGGHATLFTLSTGGRWYTSRRDASPFVGGGLSWLFLTASDYRSYDGNGFYGQTDGLAPYAEGGVELLRLHRARLRATVRADFVTQRIRGDASCDWDPDYRVCTPRPRRERYILPLTFSLGISF